MIRGRVIDSASDRVSDPDIVGLPEPPNDDTVGDVLCHRLIDPEDKLRDQCFTLPLQDGLHGLVVVNYRLPGSAPWAYPHPEHLFRSPVDGRRPSGDADRTRCGRCKQIAREIPGSRLPYPASPWRDDLPYSHRAARSGPCVHNAPPGGGGFFGCRGDSECGFWSNPAGYCRINKNAGQKELPTGSQASYRSDLQRAPFFTGEIAQLVGRSKKWVSVSYLKPMIRDGQLEYIIPGEPSHPVQRYTVGRSEQEV